MARSTGTKSRDAITRTAFAIIIAATLTGCAANPGRPWDPPPGRDLFEQAPKPRGWSAYRCCGHLHRCESHQTPYC
jgi:hypothetical protein